MGAVGADRKHCGLNSSMTDETADRIGLAFFTDEMRRRLQQKRREGRGGWFRQDDCEIQVLRDALMYKASLLFSQDRQDRQGCMIDYAALREVNLVDIANYAMMLWNRQRMDADGE